MSGQELTIVGEAFASNWIAPVGPHVKAFEQALGETVGVSHVAALASGTAALHLALLLAGVKPGDEVFVSTLTFSASVNPIYYVGARPVFIDSELQSWNLDPSLLEEALESRRAAGRMPAALVLVHLYGQTADLDPIVSLCEQYGVPLIEDAAEVLGATYRGRHPGTFGCAGVLSFNGNKIITTSGGGALVSNNGACIEQALKLATQAREPKPHYEHEEIGYNYRLSNVLAAIGLSQLGVLEDRVQARRRIFEVYRAALADTPGLTFQPEAPWGRHTRWLTCIQVDPEAFGADREALRLALDAENIEARPLWKPMHRQPVFAGCAAFGGSVSDRLFERGLCLPSGSAMTSADIDRVVDIVRLVGRRGTASTSTLAVG